MLPSPADLYKANQKYFIQYLELLKKWNQKINLTSLTDDQKIIELHFIDSLYVFPKIVSHVPRGTILDFGSGGGFPGIPIGIVCPNAKITVTDSIKKKCDFMDCVVRELHLKNVSVQNKRLDSNHSIGEFDVIVSRATTSLLEFIKTTSINLEPNGIFISMKSADVEAEISELEASQIGNLFKVVSKDRYTLPLSVKVRTLIIVSRVPRETI